MRFGLLLLASLLVFPAMGGQMTLTFESLSEGDILSSQFAPLGVTVSGQPVVLTAGSLLNEVDFPPVSGVNVLADLNGPISFLFDPSSIVSIRGFVTYATQLSFEVFGPGGVPLTSSTSAASSNLGANELFQFAVAPGEIDRLVISGDPAGQSFTLDNLTFSTGTTAPEPSSYLLVGTIFAGLLFWRFRHLAAGLRGGPVIWGVKILGIVGLIVLCEPAAFSQARRFNSIIAVPDLVYTGTPTTVTVVANVEPNASLIIDSITLNQITNTGGLVRVIGRMYDDGTHGDAVANDYNYTAQVPVMETAPTILAFRATAAYRGVVLRTTSAPVNVTVAAASYSEPVNPMLLRTDTAGAVFAVNHLVVAIVPGTTTALIQGLANSVHATIVGFSSSANVYQFRVATSTVAELEAMISTLASNPIVANVSKNVVNTFETAVSNDLTQLKAVNPVNTAAYDKIQAIEGFQSLVDLKTKFSNIRAGVLDTGVLGTHDEYAGVSLVGTVTDTNGHGTSVASIMGANNRSAFGSYPSGQFNGLLAGVPSTANASGSAIAYTLDSRQTGAIMDTLARIDDLAAGGARVVNMSFAWTKAGVLTSTCAVSLHAGSVSAADFAAITTYLRNAFKARKSILFVAAAGNYGIDAANSTPANIDEPNVLTVGATSLSDGRVVWGSNVGGEAGCNSASNFGAGVDLAAPGISVYAASIGASKYTAFAGTSAAAPLVSGAAALVLAINTGLDPSQLADILKKTGDQITTDQTIGGVRLNVKAAVRYVAQPVDLFMIVDETGSFADDVATFKTQSASIVQGLISEKLNISLGLARFEDYPVNPWGNGAAGDRPYTRLQDLMAAAEDTNGNGVPDIIDTIHSLFTRDGNDYPEAQLSALYQAATGAGQTGPAGAEIPAGLQANWRENSLRLIILWTDAGFHRPGDSGPFPYPGPSFSQTIDALNAKSIHVIGILGGLASDARADLSTVAAGTGALAPDGGLDCNGDKISDVPVGSPMVCQISSNGAGISQAIINTVLALAKK